MEGGGLDDLSDELSSIPSYDMGLGYKSGEGAAREGEHSAKEMIKDMRHLDRDAMLIPDMAFSNDIDMKDLDINEHEKIHGRFSHDRKIEE